MRLQVWKEGKTESLFNYTGGGEWQTSLAELFCSAELTGAITQPTDMPFSVKHFFVYHCIFGKYSDPSFSFQRDFTSSAVQTLASKLSDN